MCLIDKRKYRFAEKDIPIWKVAIKMLDNNYYSPFYFNKLYRINRTINEKKPNFLRIFIDSIFPIKHIFGKGYFHAFNSKYSALSLINSVDCNSDFRQYHILEGYIPKGTRYAIEGSEICAREIILNI